jgi:hypothetical protein
MSGHLSSTPQPEPQAGPPDVPLVYGFPKDATGLLPWSHAESRLEQDRNYWLATTRPDGRPHVTPLWGVWVDGALYFDGLPTTRWGRDPLRRVPRAANPAATAHLESGDDVVIIEGIVEDLTTTPELAARIVATWYAKYGRLAPEPDTRGIFRLRPRTARAWSTSSLADGTRWRFPTGAG